MEKKYRRNEAKVFGTKNTVIMIVSILAVGLFIGMALEPITAVSVTNLEAEPASVEDECLPCTIQKKVSKMSPPVCKTCKDAVKHIINKTMEHVQDNFPWEALLFPGWAVELSCYVFEGIIKGIQTSDFEFEIDFKELNETINYWIERFLDPHQNHTITKVMFFMNAILVGIGDYLLSQCNDKNLKDLPSASHVIPRFYKLIMAFLIIGKNI
jgi:hypothetical protein